MRTSARELSPRRVPSLQWKPRHDDGAASLMSWVFVAALLLTSLTPNSAEAISGVPPSGVGVFAEQSNACGIEQKLGSAMLGVSVGLYLGSLIPIPFVGTIVGGLVGGGVGVVLDYYAEQGCSKEGAEKLAAIYVDFNDGYMEVEGTVATAGRPDNCVHSWANVLIQDFMRQAT